MKFKVNRKHKTVAVEFEPRGRNIVFYDSILYKNKPSFLWFPEHFFRFRIYFSSQNNFSISEDGGLSLFFRSQNQVFVPPTLASASGSICISARHDVIWGPPLVAMKKAMKIFWETSYGSESFHFLCPKYTNWKSESAKKICTCTDFYQPNVESFDEIVPEAELDKTLWEIYLERK